MIIISPRSKGFLLNILSSRSANGTINKYLDIISARNICPQKYTDANEKIRLYTKKYRLSFNRERSNKYVPSIDINKQRLRQVEIIQMIVE